MTQKITVAITLFLTITTFNTSPQSPSFYQLQTNIGSPQRSIALINGPRVQAWNAQQEKLLQHAFDTALARHEYQQAHEISALMGRSGLRKHQAWGKNWQKQVQQHQANRE